MIRDLLLIYGNKKNCISNSLTPLSFEHLYNFPPPHSLLNTKLCVQNNMAQHTSISQARKLISLSNARNTQKNNGKNNTKYFMNSRDRTPNYLTNTPLCICTYYPFVSSGVEHFFVIYKNFEMIKFKNHK